MGILIFGQACGSPSPMADAGTDAFVVVSDSGVDAGSSDGGPGDVGPTDANMDDAASRPPPPDWDGTLGPTPICSPQGWCWVDMDPTSNDMFDGITLGTDTWAVGAEGTILHFAPSGVTGVTAATPGQDIVSISGPAADDLFILAVNERLGVEGSGSGSPPTAPRPPRVYRWDGTHFTLFATPAFGARVPSALFAASDSDVWIVGTAGLVTHWDGSSWTTLDPSTGSDLKGVWGRGTDVWMGSATMWTHWDGTTFAHSGTVGVVDFAGTTAHVWGAGPHGAYEWDGTSFAAITASPWASGAFQSVAAASDTNAYWRTAETGAAISLVFDAGVYSGGVTLGCRSTPAQVWAAGTNDYWFASPRTGPTFSAGPCMLVHGDPRTTGTLVVNEVTQHAAASPNVAVDHGVLYQWTATTVSSGDGRTYTPVTTGIDAPTSVRGSSMNDVWVTDANGHAAHFDGISWTRTTVSLGEALTPVASASSAEAWVAAGSTVYRWDGSAWSSAHTSAAAIATVDVVGSSLWVSSGGMIEVYDGTAWDSVPAPIGCAPMMRFTPASSGDVWLSGGGQLCRYHAGAWTTLPMIPATGLLPASTTTAYGEEAWATSLGVGVYRWTGDRWDQYFVGTDGAMTHLLPLHGTDELWLILANPIGLVHRELP